MVTNNTLEIADGDLPDPGKCFNCECLCTGEDYCYGCKAYVCEGCDVNGLNILGDEHEPREHLDYGAPDSWPEDLSEQKAAELRASMVQPPEHDLRVELHVRRMTAPYDHPDCICTETVVGKDTCPVHGKLPSLGAKRRRTLFDGR